LGFIAAIGVVCIYLTHTTHRMAFDFRSWQLNDHWTKVYKKKGLVPETGTFATC